jgi:2-methylisocitrate lyase-like PEP mutase family enzyme
MVDKIEAAVAARESPDLPFILARTDAIQPEGLDKAIERADKYLQAGADGVYLEGPTSEKQLETIGKHFKGVPLATSVLERGGATPWLPAKDLYKLGFTMILYPASIIFRVAKTIQDGLIDLLAGTQIDSDNSVDMKQFEKLLNIDYWKKIESKYHGGPESGEG